jgi:hypothetical protein
MFSMITNIYNNKTIGPTLIEVFTATGKLKKFYLTTRYVRCVHHGWHGTRSTSSPAVNGPPLDFCLHRHPVSVNCLYHARMVLSVGGSFAYFARNARCTATTDLLMWYSNTRNDLSPERPFSHYTHSHRLAAEMWTTMKNILLGGGIVVTSICTGFVNTCPTVFL